MNKQGKKVFVGVSGGVDSSVSLALLQKAGYDVTGVFLKVWHPDFLPCDWKEERRSAMRVCATLGVPFLTIDCEAEYKADVVDYMLAEYKAGRVPNPDVFCNKYVKFGVFLRKAREMGADFVATGHYAQVEVDPEHPGLFCLRESVDANKDQSYFLHMLDQEQLAHALFPVGHLTKPEVRALATEFGLPTAAKKDSQGLCFIGKVDMKEFLSHYITTEPGDVLDLAGTVIGRHDGALLYTIGERHGFTITKKSPNDPRFFVVSKDLAKNTITVADKESDKEAVYNLSSIFISNPHFISGVAPNAPIRASVRIRYRQEKQLCTIEPASTGCRVLFDNPQSAIAVGQSAVFYDSQSPTARCLGGGVIDRVE